MKNCTWLRQGSTDKCNIKCRGEFCKKHKYILSKNPQAGPRHCVGCNVGVRGQYRICNECGGDKYRTLMAYYRRRIEEGVLIPRKENPPTEEEYYLKLKKD